MVFIQDDCEFVSRYSRRTRKPQLTAFRVGERHNRRQQTRCRSATHNLAIMEEGIDGDGTLAHVNEALRYPHDEQTVWLFVIVASQLSQHLR